MNSSSVLIICRADRGFMKITHSKGFLLGLFSLKLVNKLKAVLRVDEV